MELFHEVLIKALILLLVQSVACESFLRGLQVKPSKAAQNDYNKELNAGYLNQENGKYFTTALCFEYNI